MEHANNLENKSGNKPVPMKSQFEDLSNYSKCQMMENPLRNDVRCCVLKLQEPQDYIPQRHNSLPSATTSIAVFIIIHPKG